MPEPLNTSSNYSPYSTYMAPVGRLPVLGKTRAEVDRLRMAIANDYNTIVVRTAAQEDSNWKIHTEGDALITQTEDNTRKITGELDALATRVINETNKIDGELVALAQKTDSETNLLDQKAVTELSQTSDFIPVDAGMNTATDVQGVILKQKNLFQKQTDGFDRDAEQKLAKIMVDTWSVRATTDTALPLDAGLADSEIQKVILKAKAGINEGNPL